MAAQRSAFEVKVYHNVLRDDSEGGSPTGRGLLLTGLLPTCWNGRTLAWEGDLRLREAGKSTEHGSAKEVIRRALGFA